MKEQTLQEMPLTYEKLMAAIYENDRSCFPLCNTLKISDGNLV
jgi:hypothetical protein